jgi:hypothetical protein
MRYIKVCEKKVSMAKDEQWTTIDIVKLIAQAGKNLNSGHNIFAGEKILKEISEVKQENKRYIAVEDEQYNLILKDSKEFSWGDYAVKGSAFAEDLKNIINASENKPADIDEKIVYAQEFRKL